MKELISLRSSGILWQSIPVADTSHWCQLASLALHEYEKARNIDSEEGIHKTIKTILELPQRALRKIRGNSRQLRKQITFAKNHLHEPLKNKPPHRPPPPPNNEIQWEKAIGLANRGHFRRAMKCLKQQSLPLATPETTQLLQELHPKSKTKPPKLPQNTKPIIIDRSLLTQVINKVNNGSSSSLTGWNGDLLATLTKNKESLALLSIFIQDIINGNIPEMSRILLLGATLIAGPKPDGVRPIAIGETFVKVAAAYCLAIAKKELPKIFEPIQLGAGSKSGVERAVHSVRAALELGEEGTVLFTTDQKNAHNAAERRKMLEELYKQQALKSLWRISDWKYGKPTPLIVLQEDGSYVVIASEDGSTQGCPLAAVLYSLAVHPTYKEVAEYNPTSHLVAVQDDLNIVDHWERAIPTFLEAERGLQECQMTMRRDKCKILWISNKPVPERLKQASEELGVDIVKGVKTLGVWFGTPKDTENWTLERIKRSQSMIDILSHDKMKLQLLLIFIRWCLISKATYLIRTIPPDLTKLAAEWLDKAVIGLLKTKFKIPQIDSQAQHLITSPISLGGLGLRQQSTITKIAYFSSLSAAASDIYPLLRNPHAELNVHFYHQLYDCYEFLNNQKIALFILPNKCSEFFSHFHEKISHSSKAPKIQNLLTKELELQAHTEFLTNLNTTDIIRLDSLKQANRAHWPTILPCTLGTYISDETMMDILRFHLNLPSHRAINSVCICGKNITQTSVHCHLMTCQKTRRKEVNLRHDLIKHTIAKLATKANIHTIVEPLIFTDTSQRPDVEFILGTQSVFIDVSIVHPTSATYVKMKGPHAGTKQREKKKNHDYKQRIEDEGAAFFPFVLDTYGYFAPQTEDFLKLLVTEAQKATPWFSVGSVTKHWKHTIVSTLLRGNSLILRRGLRRCNGCTSLFSSLS